MKAACGTECIRDPSAPMMRLEAEREKEESMEAQELASLVYVVAIRPCLKPGRRWRQILEVAP